MFRKTGIQDWGSCIQIECRADAGDWLDNMTHRRVPLFIRLLLSGFNPHQCAAASAEELPY
jgi:hypothetical protein